MRDARGSRVERVVRVPRGQDKNSPAASTTDHVSPRTRIAHCCQLQSCVDAFRSVHRPHNTLPACRRVTHKGRMTDSRGHVKRPVGVAPILPLSAFAHPCGPPWPPWQFGRGYTRHGRPLSDPSRSGGVFCGSHTSRKLVLRSDCGRRRPTRCTDTDVHSSLSERLTAHLDRGSQLTEGAAHSSQANPAARSLHSGGHGIARTRHGRLTRLTENSRDSPATPPVF